MGKLWGFYWIAAPGPTSRYFSTVTTLGTPRDITLQELRIEDAGLELEEQKTIDIVGAGDFVTTADDLARFDAAFDGERFLPAALREAMLTPHVEGTRGSSIGYGWFLRTTDGGNALQYHGGSGAGFRAFNGRVPRERLTVVVLSNINENTTPWVLPLIDRIVAAGR